MDSSCADGSFYLAFAANATDPDSSQLDYSNLPPIFSADGTNVSRASFVAANDADQLCDDPCQPASGGSTCRALSCYEVRRCRFYGVRAGGGGGKRVFLLVEAVSLSSVVQPRIRHSYRRYEYPHGYSRHVVLSPISVAGSRRGVVRFGKSGRSFLYETGVYAEIVAAPLPHCPDCRPKYHPLPRSRGWGLSQRCDMYPPDPLIDQLIRPKVVSCTTISPHISSKLSTTLLVIVEWAEGNGLEHGETAAIHLEIGRRFQEKNWTALVSNMSCPVRHDYLEKLGGGRLRMRFVAQSTRHLVGCLL